MAQLQTQLSAEESAAEAEHASFVLGAIGPDDAKGGAAGALDPAHGGGPEPRGALARPRTAAPGSPAGAARAKGRTRVA